MDVPDKVDFNDILTRRFAERGWSARRSGDVITLRASGEYPIKRLLLNPKMVTEDISIDIDCSPYPWKSLVFERDCSGRVGAIGVCGDLTVFGDLVEITCRGIEIPEYRTYRMSDIDRDVPYLSPVYERLSDFIRDVIREGKNRAWAIDDPKGSMQPRIGWPGHEEVWFKTDDEGNVILDDHGNFISNGAMERVFASVGKLR